MINIKLKIRMITQKAFKELYNVDIDMSEIRIQKTNERYDGDFTLILIPLIKYSKKSIEETEKDIGDYLLKNLSEVEKYNITWNLILYVIPKKI